MTRSLIAFFPLVLITACAPAIPEIGVQSQTGTTDTAEGSGNPHTLQSQQNVSTIVPPVTDEPDEWFSTLLVFDTNGDDHNDELPCWAFMFSDGTWLYSHNGFVEIAPSDPTAIEMVVDMSTNQVLDAGYVATYTIAMMVTEDYDDLGDMIAEVHDDGWGVTYTPPQP